MMQAACTLCTSGLAQNLLYLKKIQYHVYILLVDHDSAAHRFEAQADLRNLPHIFLEANELNEKQKSESTNVIK